MSNDVTADGDGQSGWRALAPAKVSSKNHKSSWYQVLSQCATHALFILPLQAA